MTYGCVVEELLCRGGEVLLSLTVTHHHKESIGQSRTMILLSPLASNIVEFKPRFSKHEICHNRV